MIRRGPQASPEIKNTQEEHSMELNYNVRGNDRKAMAKLISDTLGVKKTYTGMPECAFVIGSMKVSREGALIWDEETTAEDLIRVQTALQENGYVPEMPEEETAESTQAEETATEPTELSISMPTMEPAALERLQKMVDSKAGLIRKALDTDQLTIQPDGGKVSFSWWSHMPKQEETAAYMAFLAALCKQARESKRVTATEKPVESEKYAFRIFLIRLGFNGPEHKAVRHILLQRLSGHAAFRNDEEERKFREHRKALAAGNKNPTAEVNTEVTTDETAE